MNYSKIYENCSLCPRNCHTDRTSSFGFCQSSSQIKAARAALHHWEEPCISGTRGSGAIFFSGCTLRCCFCQNYRISSAAYGKGHHVSGAEYDKTIEYDGIRQKVVPTIEKKGARDIIRGCHNRDKGTAENERLRNPKFIFSYPKNERMIFLSGRNDAQKEISTMRVG